MWPKKKTLVIPHDPNGIEKSCLICKTIYRDFSKSRNKQTCSPRCRHILDQQNDPTKDFEHKLYLRLSNFRRKGITWSLEEELILRQKLIAGKCEICQQLVPLDKLHIDHNHTTNKFRGVICYNCNVSLGMMQENTSYLQAMITYLQTSP